MLRGVDEEQAGPPETETGSEAVQVVVLAHRDDEEQSGLPEKARTFWSCLIERLNSLKRGEVVQVVVAFGVIGLRRVHEEQTKLQHKKERD